MLPRKQPVVLYVDDEKPNLWIFEIAFRDTFPVVVVESAEAAIKIISSGQYEIGVLITDQRMPGMSGVELLDRSREFIPDVERVLITAHSDLQTVIDSVNKGQISRYISKPWRREELEAALLDCLRIYSLKLRIREIEARMLQSERLATLGQVSAGVAHEMMNPLAFLSQNVASLQRDLPVILNGLKVALDSTQNRELEVIFEDLPTLVEELHTGVEHLRAVAAGLKAQVRGAASSDVECHLEVAVAFAVKLSRAEVSRKARVTTEGPNVNVRGAAVSVTQIILNLIMNAAQAMPAESNAGRISITWEERGDCVELKVTDNGSGMSPETVERAFEAMFTTKPSGVGTGLGLSICRDLAQSFGGDISLTSKLGEGTTVKVVLQKSCGSKPVSN